MQTHNRNEVAVTDITNAHKFIDADTEIIAVSTMDPLGIGPLTMSYAVLFGGDFYAWVRAEFEELIARLNKLRIGKKAKLVVGGPGIWEFTVMRDVFEKLNIDYAVQGETEDILDSLFNQIIEGRIDKNMFRVGYSTFDEQFHPKVVEDEKFIARTSYGACPKLEEIPTIVRPSIKAMVEIMRGCGVGCDFCEVTLRPLRYYTIDMIKKEVEVNIKEGGANRAWLHSDEFFGYKHAPSFVPNDDALVELFTEMMNIKGVEKVNPTHGRISIPAGYPELVEKLSKIVKAGPTNWISVQTGLETGSEELAKKHMPTKTLPLKIGVDGSWHEIVWKGLQTQTRNYWRSAFTVQVGQAEETDDDNWETVALINKLSNSYVDGRPFEFTVTPMLNVPLGRIKSHEFSKSLLNRSQIAVYYASYRHLAKIAVRNIGSESRGNIATKAALTGILGIGSYSMMKFMEIFARKAGVDVHKAKNFGIEHKKRIESVTELVNS